MKKIAITMALAATLSIANGQPGQPGGAPTATQQALGTSYIQDKLAKGEPLLIGVRGSSSPLSFKHDGQYIGLAVDICTKAFEAVQKDYPKATFKFVEVTSSNRIDYLKEGKIDMECGSTTNTAARRQEVNFSTTYYVASVVGIKLRTNKLKSIGEVDSSTKIIYTAKTSTEKALASANIVFRLKADNKTFQTILGNDHQESFDLLSQGKGDLFANDDILLLGLKERSNNPGAYELLPEKYSVEPYGVMTRLNDKYLTVLVDKTIIDLMRSNKFNDMYDRWFLQPIPPFNKPLNIPMSRFLLDVVRFPTNITGN